MAAAAASCTREPTTLVLRAKDSQYIYIKGEEGEPNRFSICLRSVCQSDDVGIIYESVFHFSVI